jgi:hypothetical protein
MSAFFLRQHIEGCRGTALTNEQQVRFTLTAFDAVFLLALLGCVELIGFHSDPSLGAAGSSAEKGVTDGETEAERCS